MTRLLAAVRERSGEEPAARSTASDERTSRRGLRTALVGFGLLALSYLGYRRVRSDEPLPSTDELSETARDALPDDWRGASIDEFLGDDAGEEETDGEESGTSDGDGDDAEATDPDRSTDEMPGADRSTEAIEERAEEDVREEPAEPGEMAVDEDVADEESASDEGDENT